MLILEHSNLKSFSRTLEQFFLKVGQKNFGNKIPYFFQLEKNMYQKYLKNNKTNINLEISTEIKLDSSEQNILNSACDHLNHLNLHFLFLT